MANASCFPAGSRTRNEPLILGSRGLPKRRIGAPQYHSRIDIETFTARWSASGAAERANKDAFLLDLCRGTSRALRLDDVTRGFKGARKNDVEAVIESLTALGLLTVFDSEGTRRWRSELRTAA